MSQIDFRTVKRNCKGWNVNSLKWSANQNQAPPMSFQQAGRQLTGHQPQQQLGAWRARHLAARGGREKVAGYTWYSTWCILRNGLAGDATPIILHVGPCRCFKSDVMFVWRCVLYVAIGCCFIMDWSRAIVAVTFFKLIGLLLSFLPIVLYVALSHNSDSARWCYFAGHRFYHSSATLG